MRALAALSLGIFLAGCAKDNDDRAFFNSGWIKPEEAANRRMYGPHTPDAPEKSGEPSRAEGR